MSQERLPSGLALVHSTLQLTCLYVRSEWPWRAGPGGHSVPTGTTKPGWPPCLRLPMGPGSMRPLRECASALGAHAGTQRPSGPQRPRRAPGARPPGFGRGFGPAALGGGLGIAGGSGPQAATVGGRGGPAPPSPGSDDAAWQWNCDMASRHLQAGPSATMVGSYQRAITRAVLSESAGAAGPGRTVATRSGPLARGRRWPTVLSVRPRRGHALWLLRARRGH